MLALGLATSDLGALSVAVLERSGLTHPKYNVLRMLAGAGERGLTHSDIVRWMVTGVPDVTRLVDDLERRALVRRERDAGDRRKVRHYITAEGRALLAEIQPALEAVHSWIEQALPAVQREQLVSLCETVIQKVRDQQPPEAPE